MRNSFELGDPPQHERELAQTSNNLDTLIREKYVTRLSPEEARGDAVHYGVTELATFWYTRLNIPAGESYEYYVPYADEGIDKWTTALDSARNGDWNGMKSVFQGLARDLFEEAVETERSDTESAAQAFNNLANSLIPQS